MKWIMGERPKIDRVARAWPEGDLSSLGLKVRRAVSYLNARSREVVLTRALVIPLVTPATIFVAFVAKGWIASRQSHIRSASSFGFGIFMSRSIGKGALTVLLHSRLSICGVAALLCSTNVVFGHATERIVITHIAVIDGTGSPLQSDMSILIENGAIQALGPSGTIAVPVGARLIDGHKKFAIPGLWDMHTHLTFATRSALREYLRYGVTGVRDMGSEPNEVLAWRDSVHRGLLDGPQIVTSGPAVESARFLAMIPRVDQALGISMSKVFLPTRIGLTGPGDASRVVDSLVRLGVDFVKVRTVPSVDAYEALALAAQRAGLRLAGHLPSDVPLTLAAKVGQRTIEHLISPALDTMLPERQAEVARQLVAANVMFTPTIVAAIAFRNTPDDRLRAIIQDTSNSLDPRRAAVAPALLLNWSMVLATKRLETQEDWPALFEMGIREAKVLRRAGIRFLAGSDLGTPLVYPGSSLHDELALLVQKVGLSPMEALQAATKNAAEATGREKDSGTLSVGKRADIVLLDANPLDDIRNTTRIAAVVAAGRLVYSSDSVIARRGSEDANCRGDPELRVPSGFCATIFADTVGVARHVAVAPNGDVFVSLARAAQSSTTQIGRIAPTRATGAILVLRDTNRDGRADQSIRIPIDGGTGIALHEGFIYFTSETTVQRVRWSPVRFNVVGALDTVVMGMPSQPGHASKSIALDEAGSLYVTLGSATNACRTTRGDTAPDPCPELRFRSGIWKYRADKMQQRHPDDGERYATGIRNAVAITWSSTYGGLYALSHGRDGLFQVFPQLYSIEDGAENPAEEFFRVNRGTDIGWPYCYFDPRQKKKLLAPEYGGDARMVGRCAGKSPPLIGFPAHWGPNAVLIYTGKEFPNRYNGGAFVAFHGSWNRQPLPEAGYDVVFAPFANGKPTGEFEVFADGFAGNHLEPVTAAHRPTGLAMAPDGALFITDDQRGRIWRVTYSAEARIKKAN